MSANRQVGILGGGQLAMYLCEAAPRLNVDTTVIAHSADAPAAYTAGSLVRGELGDLELIGELVDKVDVITFDLEDIPPATLNYLAGRVAAGAVEVQPAPETILLLQDKLLQKQWMVRNGLPTLPFRSLDTEADVEAAGDWFGYPCVQKTRRGGYDGKGVQILRSADKPFWPAPSIVEPCLQSMRELSVLGAKSANGEIACYEVAELLFSEADNILETVVTPANIAGRLRDTALAIGQRALSRLEGAGVFAIEMFLSEDGTVLINEISPRVHNSGHHTLESTETSQFEQHLRAILGLPLGSTLQSKSSVMLNLLYQDAFDGKFPNDAVTDCSKEATFVHWYGKRNSKAGRKVGHITTVADSSEQALTLARDALKDLQAETSI